MSAIRFTQHRATITILKLPYNCVVTYASSRLYFKLVKKKKYLLKPVSFIDHGSKGGCTSGMSYRGSKKASFNVSIT